jgi:hypothetical protein
MAADHQALRLSSLLPSRLTTGDPMPYQDTPPISAVWVPSGSGRSRFRLRGMWFDSPFSVVRIIQECGEIHGALGFPRLIFQAKDAFLAIIVCQNQ